MYNNIFCYQQAKENIFLLQLLEKEIFESAEMRAQPSHKKGFSYERRLLEMQ
jgi:hypothetical protein